MWIPESAAEVEEAACRGDLEETHTFDAKAALPTAKKNHDLAVDVDAMTVDGGSLLYGLGEDQNKRSRSSLPSNWRVRASGSPRSSRRRSPSRPSFACMLSQLRPIPLGAIC